ncbi:mechanosensitive ion channel family protein [Marinobacter sp. C2H3]|uniref:mechanosensitive ion channel family protein n=1 Tax=Marinobacter sp. C2H3 TaxID=3119003 RepID=UPI00300F2949
MIGRILGTLNTWMQDFGVLSQGWRVSLLIFALVLATAVVAYLASRLVRVLENKFSRTRNVWDDALLHAVRVPLVAFVWLQGVYWAAEVAYHFSEAEIFTANRKILEIGFIWVIVWTLLRLIKEVEKALVSPVKMKTPMDYTTVNAVSKLSRAVVFITAALIMMQTLGFSISGVLAFGGVGGIAVGFAAKDLLANFFGGMIVHLDRPFKVGDWVRSPDREIEGTVEHIGWRMTTIRTFDKRPLYVPNAAFTTISVENPSRMQNRRINEIVGIRYADVSETAAIVSDIRHMLENHDDIEPSQTLIVNLVAFNHSSLDIMVYTFTKTTDWVTFQQVKQDVLLRISDIIETHGAEVAFPTRTLHLPDGLQLTRGERSERLDREADREPAAKPEQPRSGGRGPDHPEHEDASDE